MSPLLSETTRNVRLLTFNRPNTGNRISEEMARLLADALLEADADPEICAIVLSGSGDTFCVGGDPGASGQTAIGHLGFTAAFSELTRTLLNLGKPVLAAVNGNAHAGGFSVLACCDLAVMSNDATLALPELHDGLFPILAMAVVQPLLPRKLFFDLVYNARSLTSAEAMELHLVNEIAPQTKVLARAVEIGQSFADSSGTAIRVGRQTYDAMRAMDLTDALEHARYVLPTLLAAVRRK